MRPILQIRNRAIFAGDLILIVTSVLTSFALRLDLGPVFVAYVPHALAMIVMALAIKPMVYHLFGLYRRYWAYASTRELWLITLATSSASLVLTILLMALILSGGLRGFPRSVLAIDWLLSLLSVGGLRLAVRVLAESGQLSQKVDGGAGLRRVVVVGAGDAGALVAREMRRNPQLHRLPVAFVDDDPEKLRKEIHGTRVAGRLREIADVVERYRAQEVVIAIPTAPGAVVRLVADICRRHGIAFQTIPGIYELIGGSVSVNRLREVDIGDLLRREVTRIDNELVGQAMSGRRVLVTGAGGSIGLELCRQLGRWAPSQLALLGHGENSIFEALLELREEFPHLPLIPVIADVRDGDRLLSVFQQMHPEVVFHAAAHKHVPLMEINVEEAVTNNVLGTQSVVAAAQATGVERLVLISTDKAVQPMNVMGATKRLAELIVLRAAESSGKAYVSVRFGNVLGSRGSMVPLFKRQIARGGPVTITHPDMRRYFMTIPEAVHLVLQAAAMGRGGEVFVLRMGEQVRVLDLAEDLIRLSGLEPGKDIEVVFTGARPGEKLSEDLWDEEMRYEATAHADIVRVSEDPSLRLERLDVTLEELARLAQEGDSQAILGLLNERVPGCLLGQTPPPDFTEIL
jgi:FlaA1/EpsC-like NDP-sugar epimerase